MEEKIKELVVEIKNVPNVHVSNKNGFDKLTTSFKILQHLRKSAFTFRPINEANISPKRIKIKWFFPFRYSITCKKL